LALHWHHAAVASPRTTLRNGWVDWLLQVQYFYTELEKHIQTPFPSTRSPLTWRRAVAFVGASALIGIVVVATPTPPGSVLNLPGIPWEGGPAYYDQFPAAKAAGWTSASFFPFVIWYDSVTTDQEIQDDKAYGINTFVGPGVSGAPADPNLFARNGVYTLDNVSASGTAGHPGLFLADEVDCRTNTTNDLAYIRNLVATAPSDGTFKTINFDYCALSGWNSDQFESDFQQMVDAVPGPVSDDRYWYTAPACTEIPVAITPMDIGHCRTASSYGATMRSLRLRDSADGQLKPLWNFVENFTGQPADGTGNMFITAPQLKGAVIDSIINEARGIMYFNQDMTNDSCASGNVFRDTITGRSDCATSQMLAMKEIDLQVKALAPVINTQSYQYSFGANLDTMLKWYDGSAYVFAMINGVATSQPGNRQFALPAGLTGATSVEVLNEGRTLPVSDGAFSDNFAQEYTYHIYRITP
jgi:hypothetical protein